MYEYSYSTSPLARLKQFIAKRDKLDRLGLYAKYGHRNANECTRDVHYSVFGDYNKAYIPNNPADTPAHPMPQADLCDNDA